MNNHKITLTHDEYVRLQMALADGTYDDEPALYELRLILEEHLSKKVERQEYGKMIAKKKGQIF